VFVQAHHAAREVLRAKTSAKVGWSVANRAFAARPGGEEKLAELQWVWEDLYLEGSAGDDFVGVQSYSSQWVTAEGIEPYPEHPDNTLVGTAYRPDALAMAVRHTHEVTGLPILVTENGIATSDDDQRIAYVEGALEGLAEAMSEGITVYGYLHWSLLDNYEWGHWKPTFGLIAVDRETFDRTPKPSLAWLGSVARRGALCVPGSASTSTAVAPSSPSPAPFHGRPGRCPRPSAPALGHGSGPAWAVAHRS